MSFDINKFTENKKFKNIFIVVLIAIVMLLGISIITLSILGNKTRVGYLTDFNLNIDETFDLNNLENVKDDFTVEGKLDEEGIKNYIFTNENITDYVYHFRIRYYDKIFRNSDIYGVYVDLSNLPDYMKNAKMEKGGSPYGNFISDRKTIEEEKIDNINYTLKIKSNITIIPILLLLTIFILYLIIAYFKNIKLFLFDDKYKKHRVVITIIYTAFFIIFIIFTLIYNNQLLKKEYTSNLSDLSLIAQSGAGYVYKAKIDFDNPILKIKKDSIQFLDTNFIRNYGYAIEITNKPAYSWHSTNMYYTRNNTFIINNKATNVNGYQYPIQIPTYTGDKYKITIFAKQIPSSETIKWHLNGNNNFIPITSEEVYNDYIILSDTRMVFNKAGGDLNLHFIFPKGTTEIESILIENININSNIIDDNSIIFTCFDKINSLNNLNIKYKLKINSLFNYLLLSILFIIIILYGMVIYKSKKQLYLIIALTFIPILIYFIYICWGGVNIPLIDDYELLMYYDKIKNSNLNIFELLSLLFYQHNEHRIFFPRIIAVPFLALTKWNVKGLMFLSFFIYLIGYLFIMKYFYKNTIKEDKSKLFLSILITVILFSLKQEENIIWGFQIAWYMVFTSVVISFYFLDKYFKSKNIKHIIISIIFGIIASFSSAHGLIIWLSIFSLFILSIISREKNYYKTFIPIILFGIVCFIIYFNNYTNLSGGKHPKFFSGNIIKFFLSAISSSIIYNKISVFSFVFIFLTIYIIIYLAIKKKILENAFPLLMLIYSYGFIASVTMSRALLGLGSRYITFINLLPISLFILYLNNFITLVNKDKYITLFKFAFIILSLIIFIDNINIFSNVKLASNHRKNLQYILRNYKSKNTSQLRMIHPNNNREVLEARFYILEKYKFGVFSDRYDYLDDNEVNKKND